MALKEGKMAAPRFMVVKVTLDERDDGGLRVSSSTLPGLILSGSDPKHVFSCIAPAITALLKRKGIAPVHVECAVSPSSVLDGGFPCDVDMHVRSIHSKTTEQQFVVELPQTA